MVTHVPIFIIIGPPAVGKSTTSRAIAAHFPKSIHIPVDDFRDMVVSGLVLPGTGWSDELAQQISLARSTVVHMAQSYQAAGFVVVIDDFWDAGHPRDYKALFHLPNLHRVVLLPNQAEAHQRNLERSGNSPSRVYIDGGIRIVYEQLITALPQLRREGYLIIDTTNLSIEATVTTILQRSGFEA
jgi:hypothetical protein